MVLWHHPPKMQQCQHLLPPHHALLRFLLALPLDPLQRDRLRHLLRHLLCHRLRHKQRALQEGQQDKQDKQDQEGQQDWWGDPLHKRSHLALLAECLL